MQCRFLWGFHPLTIIIKCSILDVAGFLDPPPNQELFSKIRLCHFYTFKSPNFMQKTRKILRDVSEKTALPTKQPTNQPIITNNNDLIGPRWRRSKKKLFWFNLPLQWKNEYDSIWISIAIKIQTSLPSNTSFLSRRLLQKS